VPVGSQGSKDAAALGKKCNWKRFLFHCIFLRKELLVLPARGSGVVSPEIWGGGKKFGWGGKSVILGEKHYFLWKNGS